MAKNTLKLAMLAGVVLVWLPSGLPDDFVIIPFIIQTVGFTAYVLISIVLVYYLYRTIDGRTLSDKLRNVKREIKTLMK